MLNNATKYSYVLRRVLSSGRLVYHHLPEHDMHGFDNISTTENVSIPSTAIFGMVPIARYSISSEVDIPNV